MINQYTVQDTADSFTTRERDILRLLDEGNSDHEIAQKLNLALSTIKWYNRQIYDKLGVKSRTQAIARAQRLGLLGGAAAPGLTHNLPAQTTGLVGRKHEISEARRLLQSVRLLTLSGPPGTGKTRLALQVAADAADEYRDGVHFISLAPIAEASLVASAIAAVLDITEVVSEPLVERLKHGLAGKQLLLVLDNFEHVLESAVMVSELLAAAPELKVLVTSREILNLRGEHEYFVPPLALPGAADGVRAADLAQNEAVMLFLQRAQAANSGFEITEENAPAIARICARLDGLPLAIELAAARTRLLTPGLLLDRLTSRLQTLTGGSRDLPYRQQTLRGTIDWSYNLLDPAERQLFAGLAVFAGGCSLEAAESVCGETLPLPVLDGLASLVDKSLVQQTVDALGGARFVMLETIREYALERLAESGATEALHDRLASYFIAYAERAEPGLSSIYRSDWLTRLETEQNNFRTILSRALAGNPEPGLRLIAAVGVCWRVRSYLVEGFNWARRLLEKSGALAPALRARALSNAGCLLSCYLGNYADADRMSREALDLALVSGDKPVIAGALYARAAALIALDPEAAQPFVDEALGLFRALDNRWECARALNLCGELVRLKGDYATAGQRYQEALSLYRELGNPWGINSVLQNLGYIAEHEGDFNRAAALFTEALTISQELADDFTIAACLVGLGGISGVLREPRRAARLFGSAEALREMIGAHVPVGDLPDYERNLALAQAQLDEPDFRAAWAEGRRLTLDQALAAAFEVGSSLSAG